MIRKVVACDVCLIVAESEDGVIDANAAPGARHAVKRLAGWHFSRGRDICTDCWDEGER